MAKQNYQAVPERRGLSTEQDVRISNMNIFTRKWGKINVNTYFVSNNTKTHSGFENFTFDPESLFMTTFNYRFQSTLRELMFSGSIKTESLGLESLTEIFEALPDLLECPSFINPNVSMKAEIIKLICTTTTFAYFMLKSRSSADTAMCFGILASSYSNYDFSGVKDYFLALYAEVSSESYSATFSHWSRLFLDTIRGSTATILRNTILQLVGLKLFNKDISAKVVPLIGKPIKSNVSWFSLMENVVGLLETFFRAADRYEMGLPLKSVFWDSNPIQSAISDMRTHLLFQNLTFVGTPPENYSSMKERNTYIGELRSKRIDLEKLRKTIKGFNSETLIVDSLISEAVSVERSLMNQVLADDRTAPIAIVIHGLPGIGKSAVIEMICKEYCRAAGIEYHPNLVFHRVTSSEYFEGYDPETHRIMHYSELGNSHVNIVSKSGDPVINELLSIIDDVPYVCNMASLDSKGKVFARPGLVIIDTNNKDLHLKKLFYSPSAFRRRFLFVGPTVLPQFLKDDSTFGIDSSKSIQAGGDLYDRWTFDVSKYEPLADGTSREDKIIVDGSTGDFKDYMKVLYTEHCEKVSNRQKVKAQSESMTQFRISENDSYIASACFNVSLFLFQILACLHPLLGFIHGVIYLFHADLIGYQNPYRICRNILNDMRLRHDIKKIKNGYSHLIFELSMDILLCFLRILISVIWGGTCKLVKSLSKFLRLDDVVDFIGCIFFFIGSCYVFLLSGFLGTLLSLYITTVVCISLIVSKGGARGLLTTFLEHGSRRALVKMNHEFDTIRIRIGRTKPVQHFNKNKGFYVFVLSFVSGYMIMSKFMKKNIPSESSNFLTESPDNIVINEIEDKSDCGKSYPRVKVKDSQIWNTVDMPDSHPKTRNTLSNIQSCITKNVRNVIIEFPDSRVKTRILGVKGNLCLINRHPLRGLTSDIIIKICPSGKDQYDSTRWLESRLNIDDFHEVTTDILIFEASNVIFKDITDYFSKKSFTSRIKHPGYVDGDQTSVCFSGKMNFSDVYKDFSSDNVISYPFSNHERGKCGTPIISDFNGGVHIAGIHTGGAHGTGYAITLDYPMLSSAMSMVRETSPFVEVYSECLNIEVENPGIHSLLKYEDTSPLRCYGKIPGIVRVNNRSKVKFTPFARKIESITGQSLLDDKGLPKMGKPMMKGSMRDGKWISPYNVAIKKLARSKKGLDRQLLRRIIDEDLKKYVTALKGLKVCPLDVETAINGSNEDAYLRSMNASTASGFGFEGKKSSNFPIVYEDTDKQIREPTSNLKDRIKTILETYEKGKSHHPIYTGCLKDEVRSMKKCVSGATRMFYIGPMDYLIVARMYLAPILTLMSEHSDLFCTSVGVNIVEKAESYAKRFEGLDQISGDFKDYDFNIPGDIRHSVNTLLIELSKALGYNDHAVKILTGILSDNLYPLLAINLELFQTVGVTVSGMYGTTEINCHVTRFSFKYIFYKLYPEENFDDCLEFMSNGDDSKGGIKKHIGFDMFVVEKTFLEEMNMVYTTPSKTVVTQPYYKESEVDYLKRKIVYREDLGLHVPQLDPDSLLKMGAYYIPSNSVSKEVQFSGTLRSFCIENFLHRDRDSYEMMIGRLLSEVFPLAGLDDPNILPTYDDCKDICFPHLVDEFTIT